MLRLVAGFAAAVAFAADPLSIAVERSKGDVWNAVDPSLVFVGGDEIRFRLRSSEPGFLYILNETVRGERLWIYPPPGNPSVNSIEPGRDYIVPESEASFAVARQPGFESVYFILTTVRLPSLPAAMPPPEQPSAQNTLLPRCNEGSLRARGLCMDDNAGTRTVQDRRRIRQLIGTSSGRIWIQELRLAHK